jgi:uncharacterized membrane protein
MNNLPANAGFDWFKCGWSIFRPDAIAWVFMAVVIFLLAMVSSFIPVLGTIALMLAMPLLLAGIYRMAAGEEKVKIGGLFSLFKDAERRTPLMMLGLVMLGVSLLLSLIMGTTFMGSLGAMSMEGAAFDPTEVSQVLFTPVNMLVLLVVILIQLVVSFGYFFAIGLVTFRGESPVNAFVTGVKAAVSNIVPLIVFGLVYVLLAIMAAIPFMLGFLLLVPVTLIAGYCAYRDVLSGNLIV